jgi:hypothetical protein
MCIRSTIKATVVVATLLATSSAQAQGSAGTGSTSTGIGQSYGPDGPGVRGIWTQQPGVATNARSTRSNLSPAQKNSIPPLNSLSFQSNRGGYQR